MKARFAYVLFNNDYPELIYESKSAAEADATKRQQVDKDDATNGQTYSYWHVHTVEVAP